MLSYRHEKLPKEWTKNNNFKVIYSYWFFKKFYTPPQFPQTSYLPVPLSHHPSVSSIQSSFSIYTEKGWASPGSQQIFKYQLEEKSKLLRLTKVSDYREEVPKSHLMCQEQVLVPFLGSPQQTKLHNWHKDSEDLGQSHTSSLAINYEKQVKNQKI